MSNKNLNGYVILPSDTKANWEALNLIIPKGLLCLENDNSYLKLGDGVTHWNDLPYRAQECFTLNYKWMLDNPNVPNGVVVADAAGLLADDQIPAIFKSYYVVFSTEAERDAYPASLKIEGMRCYVVSVKQEYQLTGGVWTNLPTIGAYALLDLLYVSSTKVTLPTGSSAEQLFSSVSLGANRFKAGDIVLFHVVLGYTAASADYTVPKTFYLRANGSLITPDMSLNRKAWVSSSLLCQWNIYSGAQVSWPNPAVPFGHAGSNLTGYTTTVDLSQSLTVTTSGALNSAGLSDTFSQYSFWILHMRKM